MANYTRFMMQGLFEYLIINTNDVIVSKQALFNCYSPLIACLLRIQKPIRIHVCEISTDGTIYAMETFLPLILALTTFIEKPSVPNFKDSQLLRTITVLLKYEYNY